MSREVYDVAGQRVKRTEYEGDDSGECTDGADNDRDGDFDCADADCAESPDCAPLEALRITGSTTGTIRVIEGNRFGGCEGTFDLQWDTVAGTVTGTATCDAPDLDYDLTGDVVGRISGTGWNGTWSVMLPDPVDVPITGDLAGTRFTSTYDVEGSWGYFNGEFSGYSI